MWYLLEIGMTFFHDCVCEYEYALDSKVWEFEYMLNSKDFDVKLDVLLSHP